MDAPKITNTATLSVSVNSGLLVGHHSGPIHFTAAPERAETPPRPSCLVPFRRDPDFVTRETLLDQIRQRCAAPASRVALVGLGGMGKSQLAIEYCYRTFERSPGMWIFWVHASNNARLEQGFREIAEQVKTRGRKDPQANPFKLVHDWLRDEKNGPWLLVLDNADDMAVLSWPASDGQTPIAEDHSNRNSGSSSGNTLQQHLSRYLPPSRHGSVLVTSRTRHAAVQMVEDSDIISVEPMDSLTANALIRKKLGNERETDSDITELAGALDNMPLALVQAAAYIRERAPRCSVRQYLEEYYKSDSRKTSLLNHGAGRLRRDEAASSSVLITWQISFEHLQNKRRSAADLLSLMSFFDRQGIHETLLRHTSGTANQDTKDATDENLEDDIVILRDYSLITVTEDANVFEMHSLVQLATRTWLSSHGQLNHWRGQFITRLCAELPTGEYENWEKCQALFPHARAALAQRPQTEESLEEWALLLYKAAWYALRRGRAAEAEDMSTITMEIARELVGDEHSYTLSCMDLVGLVCVLRGKYEEGESIHRQTLARNEKVLGPEHPDTLRSMSNLASALDSQGKYEEGESIYRQTLARMEKVLGPDHPHTLASMNNLALVLMSWGKYKEAESTHRQMQARKEKLLGPKHPDTLVSMSNLALLLLKQGKYEEAESVDRQTLARMEKVLGLEHPHTLKCMNNLALILDSQGKYKEAESTHRQTLARIEKVLGPEHPHTLISMSNLAVVLMKQGKSKEAEPVNRQTLARQEKVLGPEHPDTLRSMHNLALVLHSWGKYKEAESTQRQTLVRMEKALGPEHPDTLMSMSILAEVLDSQGKYEEAGLINRQTLARREKLLGPEHPDTLSSVHCLAHHLAGRHYYKESLALYERACAGYQTVLGTDHPTARACRQHYAKAQKNALMEQGSSNPSTQNPEQSPSGLSAQSSDDITSTDDIMSIRPSNTSRLARRLAKFGLRKAKGNT